MKKMGCKNSFEPVWLEAGAQLVSGRGKLESGSFFFPEKDISQVKWRNHFGWKAVGY